MLNWNTEGISKNSKVAREGIFFEEVEAETAALAVNLAQSKTGHDLDGVWHAWLTSNDESSTSLP
jgi:hypothetical protein